MIKSLLFQNFSSNNSTTFDENLISSVKCKRAKDESLTSVVVFIVSYFYLFYFRSQLVKLKVGSILDPFSEESSYKTATFDAKLRDLWDVFVFYNDFFFLRLTKRKKRMGNLFLQMQQLFNKIPNSISLLKVFTFSTPRFQDQFKTLWAMYPYLEKKKGQKQKPQSEAENFWRLQFVQLVSKKTNYGSTVNFCSML